MLTNLAYPYSRLRAEMRLHYGTDITPQTDSESGLQPGTGKPGNCPPEIFANMMAFTYFTREDFSRNCVTSTQTSCQDNCFAYVCAVPYWMKLLTNQCTMLLKLPAQNRRQALRR